jgi:hypothetical protein
VTLGKAEAVNTIDAQQQRTGRGSTIDGAGAHLTL